MQINFKELSKSKGYKKLKAAVLKNIDNNREHLLLYNGKDLECSFNVNGCRKSVYGCNTRYCDKFRWVIDRLKHYSHALNIDPVKLLNAWESRRNYWYMNYYQECNFPKITSNFVYVFETLEESIETFKGKGFRCPHCNGISTSPYRCDSGVVVNNKKCNWVIYGLFRDLGKGVFIYIKEKVKGNRFFYPIAWENNSSVKP